MDSRVATYQHILTVQGFLGEAIAQLQNRQLEHDKYKLVSPEVEVFDEFTPKLAASTYSSEEYQRFLAAMKPALDHHYSHSRHHPEYFAWGSPVTGNEINQAEVSNGTAIGRMTLVDLMEMLADWKAATLRHKDGDLRHSIEVNQKRFGYTDETKAILINTAELLNWI